MIAMVAPVIQDTEWSNYVKNLKLIEVVQEDDSKLDGCRRKLKATTKRTEKL